MPAQARRHPLRPQAREHPYLQFDCVQNQGHRLRQRIPAPGPAMLIRAEPRLPGSRGRSRPGLQHKGGPVVAGLHPDGALHRQAPLRQPVGPGAARLPHRRAGTFLQGAAERRGSVGPLLHGPLGVFPVEERPGRQAGGPAMAPPPAQDIHRADPVRKRVRRHRADLLHRGARPHRPRGPARRGRGPATPIHHRLPGRVLAVRAGGG
mmetsp:Transcript_36113/g.115971  ORF Transcript_36113/g.115971 Transcript_36113/m.115971 type:complete len:207 (+) Transcript_36113:923-1543(+)